MQFCLDKHGEWVAVSASDDELAATIRGARGEAVEVAFAAPPDESKLPSEAAPGDLLTGTAGLCRSAANSSSIWRCICSLIATSDARAASS